MNRALASAFFAASAILLAGCVSIVSSYDATFDTSLNKLSEDTAKFLAAASVRGPERSFASKEATTYYATTDNLLDRLADRARLSRASRSCSAGKSVEAMTPDALGAPPPDDYKSFDCREEQLLQVRRSVDRLQFLHQRDGQLTKGTIDNQGGVVERTIMVAIPTFIANKPAAKSGS